jgi:phosphoglucosamine mutase
MVDHEGREIDGDQILFIIARQRLQAGQLKGPVVGTLMSNLGLERALQTLGVKFERAKVGDRYVLEMLRAGGGEIGGETTGHTLCLDRTTTGDGTITALQVLAAMVESGKPLAELASGMSKFPQVLINVPLKARAADVMASAKVKAALAAAEAQLGPRGRILLRPSGTEPLIRVMVEAQEADETRQTAEAIAAEVRAAAAA